MTNLFADIILPLAVSQPYTYRLPEALAASVTVGSRVVVPLGRRKYYTCITFCPMVWKKRPSRR